ncbi:MAG: hypothetical protein QM632_03455 [Micrococcaceae bacterium]
MTEISRRTLIGALTATGVAAVITGIAPRAKVEGTSSQGYNFEFEFYTDQLKKSSTLQSPVSWSFDNQSVVLSQGTEITFVYDTRIFSGLSALYFYQNNEYVTAVPLTELSNTDGKRVLQGELTQDIQLSQGTAICVPNFACIAHTPNDSLDSQVSVTELDLNNKQVDPTATIGTESDSSLWDLEVSCGWNTNYTPKANGTSYSYYHPERVRLQSVGVAATPNNLQLSIHYDDRIVSKVEIYKVYINNIAQDSSVASVTTSSKQGVFTAVFTVAHQLQAGDSCDIFPLYTYKEGSVQNKQIALVDVETTEQNRLVDQTSAMYGSTGA